MNSIEHGPTLEPDRVYTWDELGSAFEFEPAYLGSVGGMVSRPKQNALLLMTHPGGAKSFNYEDYWEGEDLIYTGRGKSGDQKMEGLNRDVAENTKTLHVFEPDGVRRLRYLGQATCVNWWEAKGEDDNGELRKILRFRLRFESESQPVAAPVRRPAPRDKSSPAPVHRKPRSFDPSKEPADHVPNPNRASPEETLALKEKASKGHHRVLVALHAALVHSGWREIEEIPAALDLWAVHPQEGRVIFEVKTIEPANEVAQTRSGLSQLLEYRHFHGTTEDRLALVLNGPISDARVRFLEAQGVAVLRCDGSAVTGVGALGSGLARVIARAGTPA
jgi:hypothetical protein